MEETLEKYLKESYYDNILQQIERQQFDNLSTFKGEAEKLSHSFQFHNAYVQKSCLDVIEYLGKYIIDSRADGKYLHFNIPFVS